MPQTTVYLPIPTTTLLTGDLAFRLGCSMQSRAIASANNSTHAYSHIGVIIRRDSACFVLHIEPDNKLYGDKIICETVDEFFASKVATKGCIMRHSALENWQRTKIDSVATQLIASQLTFDHDYRLSDSSQMYCTELVEYIFSEAGISLAHKRRHPLPLVAEPVILPSDIAEHEELCRIWHFDYDDLRPAR